MYYPYDFKRRRRTSLREALSFAIGYRRTLVGWYNLRLIGCTDRTIVNISPQEFAGIFPDAPADAVSGTVYVSASRAEEIGFTFAREEVTA